MKTKLILILAFVWVIDIAYSEEGEDVISSQREDHLMSSFIPGKDSVTYPNLVRMKRGDNANKVKEIGELKKEMNAIQRAMKDAEMAKVQYQVKVANKEVVAGADDEIMDDILQLKARFKQLDEKMKNLLKP